MDIAENPSPVDARIAALEREVAHLKREVTEARADCTFARMLANNAYRDAIAAVKEHGIVVTRDELERIAALLGSFAQRRDQAEADRLKRLGL
ncbi:hypothetical protein [Actinokineospora sp. NPDC004072]